MALLFSTNKEGLTHDSRNLLLKAIFFSFSFFTVWTDFIDFNWKCNRKGYDSSGSWGGFTYSVAALQKWRQNLIDY